MINTVFILFLILYFIYQGSFSIIKTCLFLILAIVPLINIKKFNFLPLSKNLSNIIFVWMSYFLLSFIITIINGFPIPNFKIFFNYFLLIPLSFTTAQLISHKYSLLNIYKILISITLLTLFLNFALFFIDFYGLRYTSIFNLIFTTNSFGALVNIESGIRFRSTNVVALIYLIPLNLHILFNSYRLLSTKFQNIIKINILLGIILVVISGRRAFQYASFLSLLSLIFPILITKLNLRYISIKKIKKLFKPNIFNIFIVSVFIFIFIRVFNILTESISINDLLNRFYLTLSAPFNSNSTGAMVRFDQFSILINGWLESPLFGHGLTSFPLLYFRHKTGVPSYEAVLHAMLYQVGLIGTIIYFAFIYYCLFGKNFPSLKAITHQKPRHAIPFATFWFIIASLSNPFGNNVVVWVLMIYYNINREKNKNLNEL